MSDQLPNDVGAMSDAAWFERTAHCGRCGQPGAYCTCTAGSPCGCRELHLMGSAREPAAIATFAEPVAVDQDALFGGDL
jgi:hypothetical protein